VAVEIDFQFLRGVLRSSEAEGPVLEVGSRYRPEGGNAHDLCRDLGLEWSGADIEPGPGVDLVLDILDDEQVGSVERRWPTVLVANLLEHVYNPIQALDNCLRLVRPSGLLVVVGPAIWQLHDFPADFWRPMPDFFIEFARRSSCTLEPNGLVWLVGDRLIPVGDLSRAGQKLAPSKAVDGQLHGRSRAFWSRLANRLSNSTGRVMHFPEAGLGVVLRAPSA